MNLNSIAAVDRNWAIGYQGKLLVSIPADMKFFRETTKGAVVLMGRKTLESFPGGRPLKGRVNIVLSSKEEERLEEREDGTVLAFRRSIPAMLSLAESYPDRAAFVIGGGSVYREMLPYCDAAFITQIEKEFPADTWFPNLEEDPCWEMEKADEWREHEDLRFRFCRYRRIRNSKEEG